MNATLQRACSSRVTLKYVTLTLTLTLMFEHPPQPRIELNSCGYAMVTRMYQLMEVYMLTPPEPDAYERRFAARLQLTRNPKIRNPNPNPNPNV
jgi:hypothetical protein